MRTDLEIKFVKELKQNQGIVHKICRIYTDSEDEHQDLFQEISIQLWKSYPKFRGDSKFSTWMYRIALNTAITLFKKNKKRVSTNSEIDFSTIKIVFDEENPDNSERLKNMYQAIHSLNDIDKALIMMYLDQKPHSEISEILGITEGNARVKMNRAKNNLKLLIKK